MLDVKNNTGLIIGASVVGLLLVAFVISKSNSSTSSTVADPNATAAINGIVTSNENAQNLQAANQQTALADGTALETAILSANATNQANLVASKLAINTAQIQEVENANDNATTLAEVENQTTAATAQTQANDDAQVAEGAQAESIVGTETAAQTTQTVATANAAKSVGKDQQTSNIFSGIASALGSLF